MPRLTAVLPLLLLLVGLTNCRETPPTPPIEGAPLDTNLYQGTGDFSWNLSGNLAGMSLPVYYHIPANATSKSPILFLFHGNGRDAAPSRNVLIAKANEYNVILLAPLFSKEDFPTNSYHLGNIFDDGEDPNAQELHPKDEWTYALLEPLFDYFVQAVGSEEQVFDAFGHSAGGQFLHRMALFEPGMNYRRIAAAASGWYTFPDTVTAFPYGLKITPIHTPDLRDVFSREVHIVVGSLDTDPNSSGLRNTAEAKLQGAHRLERAQNFYQFSSNLAPTINSFFNWEIHQVPNVAHSFQGNGAFAMDLFYAE